jgi:hypothetical protein
MSLPEGAVERHLDRVQRDTTPVIGLLGWEHPVTHLHHHPLEPAVEIGGIFHRPELGFPNWVSVRRKLWYINGERIRLDGGPTIEVESDTGSPLMQGWTLPRDGDGAPMYHREGGLPAVITHNPETGQTHREYWLNGERMLGHERHGAVKSARKR